jgi:hypothetical protein
MTALPENMTAFPLRWDPAPDFRGLCATLEARKLLGADTEVGQSVNLHGTATLSPVSAVRQRLFHPALRRARMERDIHMYVYSTNRGFKRSSSRMPKKAIAVKLKSRKSYKLALADSIPPTVHISAQVFSALQLRRKKAIWF